MRVLILSCNTGEGHNSCGKALCEAFTAKQVSCRMEDALRFLSPELSRTVTAGFTFMYRHLPGAFRRGYQYSEQHPDLFEHQSAVYRFLASGAEDLYRFIVHESFDAILCTHVFSALMLTEVMRRHNRFLHTYFVATDYTCSPSCAQSDLDAYFIPDRTLMEAFIRCGIPGRKLIPSGIPVRESFLPVHDRAEMKRRFGIRPHIPHLLVMGGSMGCGFMGCLVQRISRDMPMDCAITVICGTNRSLQAQLDRLFAGDSRITVRGFCDEIPELMDSADLFLTKPGGISVTEAAQKRLPMVFVDAVAGCETYNMRFFTGKGVALSADSPNELACLTAALLSNRGLLSDMAGHYEVAGNNTAAETIVQAVMLRRTS